MSKYYKIVTDPTNYISINNTGIIFQQSTFAEKWPSPKQKQNYDDISGIYKTITANNLNVFISKGNVT